MKRRIKKLGRYEGGPPNPFPHGWYLVDTSKTLAKDRLIEKTWLGRQIVAWRGEKGEVCVADAFCPHLGAHLGPSSGGKVQDGRLVCPFHHFEYNATGTCVRTPWAPPPRSARLKRYQVSEMNGFVFAYFDSANQPATWHPPEFPEYSDSRATRLVRIRAHPQVTAENAIDFVHFMSIHGFSDVSQKGEVQFDGPVMRVSYSLTRAPIASGFAMFKALKMTMDVEITVSGLGIAVVESCGKDGFRCRNWILAMPIDGESMDILMVADLDQLPDWKVLRNRWLDWLGHQITPRVLVNEIVRDLRKDEPIWSNQRFQSSPVFSSADRHLRRFRNFCKQFYPEPALIER